MIWDLSSEANKKLQIEVMHTNVKYLKTKYGQLVFSCWRYAASVSDVRLRFINWSRWTILSRLRILRICFLWTFHGIFTFYTFQWNSVASFTAAIFFITLQTQTNTSIRIKMETYIDANIQRRSKIFYASNDSFWVRKTKKVELHTSFFSLSHFSSLIHYIEESCREVCMKALPILKCT